jgi:hypothetical protein
VKWKPGRVDAVEHGADGAGAECRVRHRVHVDGRLDLAVAADDCMKPLGPKLKDESLI